LVNDVERFRGYTDEGFASDKHFVWPRESGSVMPEYFRFAYMEGSRAWDYTKAGTWNGNGSWTEMKGGPSKIKSRSLDGEMFTR